MQVKSIISGSTGAHAGHPELRQVIIADAGSRPAIRSAPRPPLRYDMPLIILSPAPGRR